MKRLFSLLAAFCLTTNFLCAQLATTSSSVPPVKRTDGAKQKSPVVAGEGAKQLLILQAEDGVVNISANKEQLVALQVHNASDRVLIVTHASVNTPGFLIPITPVELASGETKPLPIIFDGTKMRLPLKTHLGLRVKDGTQEQTVALPLQLASKDLLTVEPRSLLWMSGAEAGSRTCKITNLPAGVKLTGVQVSDLAFSARIEGDAILVTPADLSKKSSATITLQTEPALPKPVVISASVMPKPAGKPAAPAALAK